jgi:ABC-type molybdate transport system permease subunit
VTIPRKYAPILFGLILSGLMSLLVSGISTMRTTGLGADFLATWSGAWLTAWLVAFPVVLVVVPIARRALDRFLADS